MTAKFYPAFLFPLGICLKEDRKTFLEKDCSGTYRDCVVKGQTYTYLMFLSNRNHQ